MEGAARQAASNIPPGPAAGKLVSLALPRCAMRIYAERGRRSRTEKGGGKIERNDSISFAGRRRHGAVVDDKNLNLLSLFFHLFPPFSHTHPHTRTQLRAHIPKTTSTKLGPRPPPRRRRHLGRPQLHLQRRGRPPRDRLQPARRRERRGLRGGHALHDPVV